jgi:uncharacterized protein
VVVAFSGGLDSSLVLWLAHKVFERSRLRATHICWGPYTYPGQKDKVLAFARSLEIELEVLDGRERLEKILRHGPACNRCTRQAKLGLLRSRNPDALILTGANQTDSWGQRGQPLADEVFAPLFHLQKEEIRALADEAGIHIQPIGESNRREGCQAKHLLKPLAVPLFHGRAVCFANETLLTFLREKGKNTELANVKIVGPLRENVAVVNVSPALSREEENELGLRLQDSALAIQRVIFANDPLRLTVLANPSLLGDEHARLAVEEGILKPSFAAPLSIQWSNSANDRLFTFHVVAVEPL